MTEGNSKIQAAVLSNDNIETAITEVLPMEPPEFYHERVSYLMGSAFGSLNRQIAKANMLLETTAKDDATPEERLQVSVAKSEAYDTLDELQAEMHEFMSRIIKSVPRSWLVEGAPTIIKDGEWLDWVRHDRFVDVGLAYQEAGVRSREERKN